MQYITILLCVGLTLACQKYKAQLTCKESPGSTFHAQTVKQPHQSHISEKHGRTTKDQLYQKLASLTAKYPNKRLELNEIKDRINQSLHDAGSEEVQSTISTLLDGPLSTADADNAAVYVLKYIAALASCVSVTIGPVAFSAGPIMSLLVDVMTSPGDTRLKQWSMILEDALERSRHMSYKEKIMGYYLRCRTVTDSLNGMELNSTSDDQQWGKLDRTLPDKFGAQLLGELEGYVRNTLPTIKNEEEAKRLLDFINHYCYAHFWRINLLLRKYGLLRKMGYTGASVKNNIETPAGPNSILFLEFLYTSTQTNSEAIVTSVFYAQVDSWFGISNFLSMHKIKLPTIIPWQEQRLRNENGNYFDSACPDGTHSPRFSSSCISTKFQRDNCIHGHAQYVLPYGYKRNKCVVLVPYKEGQFLIASSGNPHLFLGEHGGYACFIELPRHHPDPSQLFALKLKNSKTSIAN